MIFDGEIFFEKVFVRNLGKEPSKKAIQSHINQFLSDSWKYLHVGKNTNTNDTNEGNDKTIRGDRLLENQKRLKSSKEKELYRKTNITATFKPKHVSNDIRTLEKMRNFQSCKKKRKDQEIDIPTNSVTSPTNTFSEKESLNDYTFIENVENQCSEYPNNFKESLRPFQRPFHLF